MESIDLVLQPADAADQLQVFLISAVGTQAFSVVIPPELAGLQG
ncbi:hypothetical protein [Cyanobium sp. LEGE 06113]|nr:hypothetical protein [Cyanobium sp. LEGE 06113]